MTHPPSRSRFPAVAPSSPQGSKTVKNGSNFQIGYKAIISTGIKSLKKWVDLNETW